MTSDIDLFAPTESVTQQKTSMTGSVPPAGTPGSAHQKAATKVGRWQDQVKPAHLLAAGVILVAVWVIWPLLGAGRTSSTQVALQSPVSPLSIEQQLPHAADLADAPEARPVKLRERGEELSGEELQSIRSELAQQRDQLQALILGQQQLSDKLALVMGQTKQLTDAAEASKQPKAATAVAMRKPAAKPAVGKPASSVAGLKVNTVYPGQAWIDAPLGKTYIVRVGDVVEGARVLSIDERRRVVETTRGFVR
ncbi:hypothetical protein [Bordetella pseudohinzii]|uniref:TraP protein n=1 Tax=Bordetella pseudohinzii TaxID=1331258 RepID=A0A0J6C473_9BORD|nr:hypothetical protein [Bordetella pseudohinzii]ANY18527.1 hypothetical protein BBN53_21130 [Bordetella pseudohinzii]KMM24072.1 hypothetical protein L540_08045 [Bordetella pseudohinzii]KXA77865.1 hypothetical protein AW878_14310 [Bordetella pseudohinzii]KXA78060.1 hypothetical protein AW877_12765 [Bordetella pseudohinzii]CUJ13469.1 Uncharacterised protein [Bordetella pseudohinzii]